MLHKLIGLLSKLDLAVVTGVPAITDDAVLAGDGDDEELW